MVMCCRDVPFLINKSSLCSFLLADRLFSLSTVPSMLSLAVTEAVVFVTVATVAIGLEGEVGNRKWSSSVKMSYNQKGIHVHFYTYM